MAPSVLPARSGAIDRDAAMQERIDELAREVARLTEEMTRLRQRVDTLTTLERFRDVALSRHTAKPLNLPDLCRLDARDFIESVDGVYSLEYTESGRPYRWTGPGHFTRFTFLVDRGKPLRIRLSLSHLGCLTAGTTPSIEVEGVVYRTFPDENGEDFIAGPLPPRAGADRTDLLLHVPVLFRPSDMGEPDDRSLGVGISSIGLEPAE